MLEKTAGQQEFADFYLPFGGHLKADNRWVARAKLIPWNEVEEIYARNLSGGQGRKGIPARVAFGALMIQTLEDLTDRETVEQIEENPYLQHFRGYREFQLQAPFDASMMVHFRKRFPKEDWDRLNEKLRNDPIEGRR